MIVESGDKTKVLFKDGDRVFMVFDGTDLVYNCYIIPDESMIFLDKDSEGFTIKVKSNAGWKIKTK